MATAPALGLAFWAIAGAPDVYCSPVTHGLSPKNSFWLFCPMTESSLMTPVHLGTKEIHQKTLAVAPGLP